jgi:DNA-directed RNA polymerase specialized sigma24 family protein
MTANDTRVDYSPQKVEYLLRRLPYLLDRQTPPGDRPARRPARSSPSGWLEDQMATRADIEMALDRLPQPTYQMVYLRFVGGQSLREVASVVKVSHTTVRLQCIEGIRMMAFVLGWRDAESGWGERRE